jgi:hypothetical protein
MKNPSLPLYQRVALFASLVVALAMATFAGCTSQTTTGTFTGSGGSGAGDVASSTTSASGGAGGTGQGGGGGCMINCTSSSSSSTGSGMPGVIFITPQDADLFVANGMIPTQQYHASLNGADVTNQVAWSYARPEIGDIGAGSVFTPTGVVGGKAILTASLPKSQGQTSVSVTIRRVVNTANITPAEITQLNVPNAGADPSLKLLYPYPETVFPLGVLAPEMMWNGGSISDTYKITLVEKYYQYTEYLHVGTPASHLISETDWKSIEDSGAGPKTDPLQVSIVRKSGNSVYQPTQVQWHIAQGRLHGSVYYWELPDVCGNGNGRVLRIKPDSVMTDQFYTTQDCYGCHSVSRDGKTMMAAFSNGSPFPQQTLDLTQNPAQLGAIQGQNLGGTFSAFNDKNDKIMLSNDSAFNPSSSVLRIVDATNGAVLNANAMGTGCGEPAWSPDGTKVAGICQLGGGGWIFDATKGNLAIGDVAPDGFTVSNVHSIVQSGAGQGRPAYPSFAPGSEYLAFGRPTQGSRSTGDGQLWFVKNDGTGSTELLRAEQGLNNSYNPVFAPLRAGGYFWLVFISRRDYGNHQALLNANRQQLWITAVEDPPNPNADPSQPAFYMRGQEDCGKSENAYYALDPCKDLGADCTSGVDCCGGQCVKDPNTMNYVCGSPPPPGQCSQDGNSCKTKADCCNVESDCIDNFCQQAPPK